MAYKKLADYLSFLTHHYNLHLNIKDFYGFIPINKELDKALQPFLAHTNPFCMYMKSESASYHRCLRMIRKMYEKFETQKLEYFFGVCHAGLGEYVIPIRHNGLLLGSINVGFFQPSQEITNWCMKKACAQSEKLCTQTAYHLYQQHISPPTIDIRELLPSLHLLAEYLGHTYGILQKAHPEITVVYRYRNSNEDSILSHSMNYIQQNSHQNISVDHLASICYCSSSYLSRIFKKRTGININTYINKTRIELSKKHLTNSKISIAEVAITVGFNDPNYFSRVFTQIMGIPPTEYRRRFRKY